MVGLCHWLAAGTLLYGLHPTVDAVQDKYHPGDSQRGKIYAMQSLMVPRIPHFQTYVSFYLNSNGSLLNGHLFFIKQDVSPPFTGEPRSCTEQRTNKRGSCG